MPDRSTSLEPVHDWEGVALERNRDELTANIPPHGLMPMQGIWWANRPISLQPKGQVPKRAVCGVAKPRRAMSPSSFCALQPIPLRRLRGPFPIVNRL
jgi:hypothetical protein